METRSKGKLNVYQSIVAEYKKLMELGAIVYGEKLPSCRALALERGINPNTVEKAYSALEKEGYIRILPKKGLCRLRGCRREKATGRGKKTAYSFQDFGRDARGNREGGGRGVCRIVVRILKLSRIAAKNAAPQEGRIENRNDRN